MGYVIGKWYRDGTLVFKVRSTGRQRRCADGVLREEACNHHTIRCSDEAVAQIVLEAMQKRDDDAKLHAVLDEVEECAWPPR